MQPKPRHRLATSQPLQKNGRIELTDNAAHYLTNVLRLKQGDALALFNPTDGEWLAVIHDIRKKQVTLLVTEQLRVARPALDMWVCFAPVKGGRLETILEKATELGASVLQPVITSRTIVDKVNLGRAEAIVREAAEQCERTNWPEIREPVKLANLLGSWPADRLLIYGDESGASEPLTPSLRGGDAGGSLPRRGRGGVGAEYGDTPPRQSPHPDLPPTGEGTPPPSQTFRDDIPKWAILTGPEGGFTPEEFALLRRIDAAKGVGLGPRILRADTAVITLSALTASLWGDWDVAPHFEKETS